MPKAVAPTLLGATREAILYGRDIEKLERAVVAEYCARNALLPPPGSPAAQMMDDSTSEYRAIYSAVESWELDDLVMAFETLVPKEEAKRYGAVFTPSPITKFMANEAVRRWMKSRTATDLQSATLLDPAVGCGAILIAGLHAIAAITKEPASTVAARLYGVDISTNSVERARVLIQIACLTMGDPVVPTPNLTVADSLTHNYGQHFDIIVANPPYVRFQQLDHPTRDALAQRWSVCARGNYNLYFPFFELAEALVDASGQVCFITPNGYFTGFAAADLREWLIGNDILEDVIDFGHHRVFEALTYTAIAFMSKKKSPSRQRAFGYADVSGLAGLSRLPKNWVKSETEVVGLASLTGKFWRLAGPRTAEAVRKVSGTGQKLSDIADVRYGVATCRDKIYLLSGETNADGNYVTQYEGADFEIEPGITQRCVKVSGLENQNALTNTPTRIIYPYTLVQGRAEIIPEAKLRKLYPKAYQYLLAARPELANRDKGQKEYAAWYAYARTQGLVPLGPKILTPLYADKPKFMADPDPTSLFINGCAVVPKPDKAVDPKYLMAILNSDVTRFYVAQVSNAIDGGYFAYQKTQIGGVGIPDATPKQRKAILSATGHEREELIADLYGLTLTDIQLAAKNPEN